MAPAGWWATRSHEIAAVDVSRCALPPRDCVDRCGELIQFTPARGPGYEDVPLADEVSPQDSTSYVRRDLMMLVQYATAKVSCLMPGKPLALGDMSDRNGDTPGTARGSPRHPFATHTGGSSIDLAYYQLGRPDNHLRAICAHVAYGVDQHHCVRAPQHLDARRTALLIGAFFESPRVRVIGVDGAAGPMIVDAFHELCRDGWITEAACARLRLAYETIDIGRGWYYSHHNHLHVSWKD